MHVRGTICGRQGQGHVGLEVSITIDLFRKQSTHMH